jgi:putative nucleotidyltransferase with HDIG domain
MTAPNVLAPFKRIRVKAALFVLLLLVSITAALYAITQRIMNERILTEVLRRSESLARSTASTAGYSITSQDLLGLDNLVYQIKSSNPDIEYIAITGRAGEILVHTELRRAGETFRPAAGPVLRKAEDGTVIIDVRRAAGGWFEIQSPVRFMDRLLGAVIMGVNKSVPLAAQTESRRKILLVFGSILVLGLASSLLLSSFLTRPIQELSAGVTELKAGRRSAPLRVYAQDELGRLTQSFNEMTALITAQRDRLSQYALDLEEAYVSTVRVLAAAIDARDAHTLGHSTRVARLSVDLGRDLGLGSAELEDLEVACLFHDVGKIKIPDSILRKQGRLSAEEQKEIRRHTEYGAEILSKAASLLKYIPGVRHHHEWYDGTGYPDGLAGARIPRSALIISLADVYDAMTSDRPYRVALSEDAARRDIAALAGRQFDPELTGRFIRILETTTAGAARRDGGLRI